MQLLGFRSKFQIFNPLNKSEVFLNVFEFINLSVEQINESIGLPNANVNINVNMNYPHSIFKFKQIEIEEIRDAIEQIKSKN